VWLRGYTILHWGNCTCLLGLVATYSLFFLPLFYYGVTLSCSSNEVKKWNCALSHMRSSRFVYDPEKTLTNRKSHHKKKKMRASIASFFLLLLPLLFRDAFFFCYLTMLIIFVLVYCFFCFRELLWYQLSVYQ